MKPDELRPTAAALYDDDGRAAMRGRLPFSSRPPQGPNEQRRVHPRGANATNQRRQRLRRNAAYLAAERERNRRRYAAARHLCEGCRAVHVSPKRTYCRHCAPANALAGNGPHVRRPGPLVPFRGGTHPEHERRVLQLQRLRKAQPL